LGIAYTGSENTGMALRLKWDQGRGSDYPRGPDWFGRAKLEELGYDCSVSPDSGEAAQHYWRATSRKAFVVLEYGGEAWQRRLAEARRELQTIAERVRRGAAPHEELDRQKEAYRRLSVSDSRLTAVDAGTDALSLRKRYPDRALYIIAPAKVHLTYSKRWTDPRGETHEPYLQGVISAILVDHIHVAKSERELLDKLGRKLSKTPPRYQVAIRYGKRYEPWVADVQPLKEPARDPQLGDAFLRSGPRWLD
jgi:hypothetical protein